MSYVAMRNGFKLASGSDAAQVVRCVAPTMDAAQRQSYSQALDSNGTVQLPTPEGMVFISGHKTPQPVISSEAQFKSDVTILKWAFVIVCVISFINWVF